jgi:protein phosphatase
LSENEAAQLDFVVEWGAATDRGVRRDLNEDRYLASPPVFLVADGMGGHELGDVAAEAVIDAFGTCRPGAWLTSNAVHEAVALAVAAINGIGSTGAASPGSTLAGAGMTIQDGLPCWLVFNVGDSRTYRLARGILEQVSVDHSQVQEMVDAGVIGLEEARTHSRRSVITRALGGGLVHQPPVDQWLLPAAVGDRLLICSDGLTGELTDALLAATLASVPGAQAAATELVRAAVAAGGRDNVTAVVVDAVAVSASASATAQAEDTLSDELWIGPDDDTVPEATDHVFVENGETVG